MPNCTRRFLFFASAEFAARHSSKAETRICQTRRRLKLAAVILLSLLSTTACDAFSFLTRPINCRGSDIAMPQAVHWLQKLEKPKSPQKGPWRSQRPQKSLWRAGQCRGKSRGVKKKKNASVDTAGYDACLSKQHSPESPSPRSNFM